MTNANGFQGRSILGYFRGVTVNRNVPVAKSGHKGTNEVQVARLSVGFEKSTRYMRRPKQVPSAQHSGVSKVKKKAYVSPDATVLLMPDAIERVAIEELYSAENETHPKKEKITLKEKIRKAAHRESLSYTMYGVDTREIFTEEIEIDVIGTSAFKDAPNMNDRASAADNGDLSSRRAAATDAIEKFMDSAEIRFRSFAHKLNNLRIGSDNSPAEGSRRGA